MKIENAVKFAVAGVAVMGIVCNTFSNTHTYTKNNVIIDGEPIVVQRVTAPAEPAPEYTIPDGDTSFKSYMDFRCITNTRSPQYRLQSDCWTDDEGLRRCGDDFVIAVGSYYADCIGERFEITLDTGEKFTAVVGDFKADAHTDETNRYTLAGNNSKNVIEFVVDCKVLNKTAKRMGDISYIDGFDGNIEKIESCEKTSEAI